MLTLSPHQSDLGPASTSLNQLAQISDRLGALATRLGAFGKTVSGTPMRRRRATGKVLVLPGLMGSRLSVVNGGQEELVWLRPADIAAGGIAKLKWPAPVKATGVMTFSYMKMLLRLRMAGFDAEYVPFDWRQSPAVTGDALVAELRRQGQTDVTLVCHSMGGLVARQVAAADPRGKIIARVITLGAPNYGSYAPVQMLDLSHPMLQTFGQLDRKHDVRTLVKDYLRDFPGLMELLPAPRARLGEDYFDSGTWPAGAVTPRPQALADAKSAVLSLPEPDARFHQIIGTGERTVVAADIHDDRFVFGRSDEGDGVVPLDLAKMGDVPRYYAACPHGQLCNSEKVIAGVLDLIKTDQTKVLESWARPVRAAGRIKRKGLVGVQ